MKATVAIPTYNGDQYLEPLLSSLKLQVVDFKYEILIIDSGSTDKTLSIIKKFDDIRLYQIPNSEFGHGRTRNLAVKLAKGEFVVFLSQDAVPSHSKWLEYMIEPFYLNDLVFCVFGKQIPRPLCDAPTKREVTSVFNDLGPNHSLMVHRMKSIYSNSIINPPLTFFSDVNSAVRKKYLLKTIPYRDVRYSEDQLLGKDVLEAGYLKIYTPQGSVFHSNEYSIRNFFYRKFDEYLGLYDTLKERPSGGLYTHFLRILKNSFLDTKFIFRDKDYGLKNKLFNFIFCWYLNYSRQKASYIVSRDNLREKYRNIYSLEKRNNQN